MTDKPEENATQENTGTPEVVNDHLTQNKFEILGEDCNYYDYSFKIIVIGNSGNIIKINNIFK